MTAKSSTTPTGLPAPPRSSVSSWSLRSSRVRAWHWTAPCCRTFCRWCPRVSSEIPNVVVLPDVPAVTACRFDLAAKLLAYTKISRWRLCDNIAVGQICLGDPRTRSARYPATRRPESGDVGRVGKRRHLRGSFIRAERQMANLSLRELSSMIEVSNPYLSQMERGLPSPRLGCEVDRPGTQPLGRSTGLHRLAHNPSRPCPTTMQRKPHCGCTSGLAEPQAGAARRVPKLSRSEWWWDNGQCGGWSDFAN
jgi:hypothetical protein